MITTIMAGFAFGYCVMDIIQNYRARRTMNELLKSTLENDKWIKTLKKSQTNNLISVLNGLLLIFNQLNNDQRINNLNEWKKNVRLW